MKSEQVLEAAEKLSSKDARSSNLYWDSRKQILYGVKNNSRLTLLIRFEGVTFLYDDINRCTNRSTVLNKWISIRKAIAMSDLIISMDPNLVTQLSFLPVRNVMNKYTLLATALRNAISADDYHSPWLVAWDAIVCAYSKEYNTFSNRAKDSMSEFLYSPITKGFKSNLENISNVLKEDNVLNSLAYFKEMLSDCYILQHKLSRINVIAPLPYSDSDTQHYAKIKLIALVKTNLNQIHSGEGSTPNADRRLFSIHNGDKLLSNWKELCSIFILMGFRVPTPFGLEFEESNIPALASLFEAANHNLKDYANWYRDMKNDHSERVTEPTSLLA